MEIIYEMQSSFHKGFKSPPEISPFAIALLGNISGNTVELPCHMHRTRLKGIAYDMIDSLIT